jgi:hypothetical protein
MNARRISRPVSVRMGMFWTLGFWVESRPVEVISWLNWAWMRLLVGSTSLGRVSM